MSQSIATIPGTCQETASVANSHCANGSAVKSLQCVSLAQSTPADAAISPELCIDAIGCAVASAASGRSLELQTADGLRQHAGFSVIIAAQDTTALSTALAHILSPVKAKQGKRHTALAMLDPEMHRQMVDKVRGEYLALLETDTMPDPDHVAHYNHQMAALQAQLHPMTLIQNPAVGRLTLAVARSSEARLLAIYDDLAVRGLLDGTKSLRGRLDFEVLAKSFNQETFDGAFLERVHDAPIVSPMVTAIIIAEPETVTRLLLSEEPEVARFVDGCLVLELPDSAPSQTLEMRGWRQISMWQEPVARLVETCPEQPTILQMSKEAAAIMEDFRHKTAARQGPGGQSRYLAQLAALVAKIALGLWAGQTERSDCVAVEHATAAIKVAEMGLSGRGSLLQTNAKVLAQTEFEKDCGRILGKIAASGPISTKHLYRKIHGAKGEWVKPVLLHLLQTEQIAKLPDGRLESCQHAGGKLKLASA